jgi:hypothetical protein
VSARDVAPWERWRPAGIFSAFQALFSFVVFFKKAIRTRSKTRLDEATPKTRLDEVTGAKHIGAASRSVITEPILEPRPPPGPRRVERGVS